MSILAFLYVFYFLYIIYKKKNLLLIYSSMLALDVVFATHINIGYFVRILGYDVDFSYASQIVLLFISMKLLTIYPTSKKLYINYLLLISIVGIGLLMIEIVPYAYPVLQNGTWDDYLFGRVQLSSPVCTRHNIIEYLKFIVFTTNILAFLTLLRYLDVKYIINKVAAWFRVIIVLGIIEFVANNMLKINFYSVVISKITGKSVGALERVYQRGNLISLQGLSREPSHYVEALFLTFIVLLMADMTKKQKKIWLVIIFLLIGASGSFSCIYVYAGLMLVLFLEKKNNTVEFRKIVPNQMIKNIILGITFAIGIYVVIVYMSNYYNRLVNFLNHLPIILSGEWKYRISWYNSSDIRLISIVEIVKIILQRPFLGIGIGSVSAHSALLMCVAQIGIIGIVQWFNFFAGWIRKSSKTIFRDLIVLMCFINIFGSRGNMLIYSGANVIYLLYAIQQNESRYKV